MSTVLGKILNLRPQEGPNTTRLYKPLDLDILSSMAGKDVQILGTKKCNNTKKALRFFSDRGIKTHFRDLAEKPPSPGEGKNLASLLGSENLIDPESREFLEKGYKYREYDPLEEILENWRLIRTPLVRYGKYASAGYKPEEWLAWLKKEGLNG